MNNTSQPNHSDHPDYSDYPEDPLLSRSEGVTWCTAYIAAFVTIVIGNLIIILVFAKTKDFRRKKFWLLMSLAVADLLVGGVAVPLDVYTVLPQYFDLWEPAESAIAVENAAVFFTMFSAFASILNLTMISLERFYATFFPFRHRLLKSRVFVLVLFMIWILAAVPYTVTLLVNLELISFAVYLYFRGLFAAVLLLTICLAYLSIWVKLKWGATPQLHRTNQRESKLTVTLFIVTMLSLIAWLPMQLLSMVLSVDTEIAWSNDELMRIDLSLRLLLFANSFVNPILYTMRMPRFKKEVVNIWLSFTCRRNSPTSGRNEGYKLTRGETRRRTATSSLL